MAKDENNGELNPKEKMALSKEREIQKMYIEQDIFLAMRNGIYQGGIGVQGIAKAIKKVLDKAEREFLKTLI